MEFLLAIGAAGGGRFGWGWCSSAADWWADALLVLLAGSCFGHPFFNVPTGAVPLTADRLLLVVLLAQYVVYRHWGWTDPKPLAKADYLLGAFLVVLLVSTLTHDLQRRPIAAAVATRRSSI